MEKGQAGIYWPLSAHERPWAWPLANLGENCGGHAGCIHELVAKWHPIQKNAASLCLVWKVIQFSEKTSVWQAHLYLEGDKVWVIRVGYFSTSCSDIVYRLEKEFPSLNAKHPDRHPVYVIFSGLLHGLLFQTRDWVLCVYISRNSI